MSGNWSYHSASDYVRFYAGKRHYGHKKLAEYVIRKEVERMALTPETQAEIADKVRGIPHNGWWHVDSEETFIRIAGDLYEHGLNVTEVIETLEWAYGAVANEFGS